MSRFPPSMGRGGGGSGPLPKRPRINDIDTDSHRVLTRLAQLSQTRPQPQPSESDKSNSESPSRSRSPSPSPSRSPSASVSASDQEEEEEEEEEEEIDGVVLSNPRVLDCTTCYLPLALPVFQCETGHFICAQCCSNNTRKKCPRCSTSISNNSCRGIELVLQSAKTPCLYMPRGCRAKVCYARKRQHEKNCEYAPCWCPTACSFADDCLKLYYHFTSMHSGIARAYNFNRAIHLTLDKNVKQIYLHEREDKKVFVLNRNSVDLGSLINVICIAPSCSPLKYTYELTVNHQGKRIMLKSAVDNAPKYIRAQSPKENCLVITNGFAKPDGALVLELIIRKQTSGFY